MQINMESGGIIADAMKRIAVHGQTIDLERHRSQRAHLANGLARQPDGTIDNERRESIVLTDSSLGIIACHDIRPTPSQRIQTSLYLVSEAVGAMPQYDKDSSEVLIGHATILATAIHDQFRGHPDYANFYYKTDILTSGKVILSDYSKDLCGICPDDLDANRPISNLSAKLSINSLYRQLGFTTRTHRTVGSHHRMDSFHGQHQMYGEPMTALRQHLRNTFPLPTDDAIHYEDGDY